MDDYLYDEPGVSGKDNVIDEESIDDPLGQMEQMLAQGMAGKSEDFLKEMESSAAKSHKVAMLEEKRAELKEQEEEQEVVADEATYEEESFEMMEKPVLSSKRGQSAKAGGGSVHFEPFEESKESTQRPQSSPAGKGSSAYKSSMKSPTDTPSSPTSYVASPKESRSRSAAAGTASSSGGRPSTAPSHSTFAYSTPGYDPQPGKTRGRKILEGVLADIYEQKRKGANGKMLIYENALPTGQVVRHQKWKYKDEGYVAESTHPVSMDLQHHSVQDYRTFRPTSANKRLMPDGPRLKTAFLLPGQKTTEEMAGSAYDGRKLREYLHKTVADGMTKVEVAFKEWEARILEANSAQCDRLKAIHRQEMTELVSGFEAYKPSECMTRLKEADRFPPAVKAKQVTITKDQVEYVDKHLHAQWQHNDDRMHVLRTRVKNRQRDELARVRSNTRAPNELLIRVRAGQEDVIRATEKKITSKIIHADKILQSVKTSINPTAALRAQRAEQHCLKFARKGIKIMEEISSNIDKVFEEALQDYITGDLALKSASLPGSSLDPKPDGTFRGTGMAKTDTIRPHSGSYTPEVYERTINGYRYRSRSPPRGSYERDVETERRLSRPSVLSARKGKLQKGYQDFLNESQGLPYSSKQYGKGREEEVSLPGLWTTARFRRETSRMQESQDEERPITAPAGALFDGGTAGLGATEPDDSSSAGADPGAPQRPKTAAAIPSESTSKSKTKGKQGKHQSGRKNGEHGGEVAPTNAWDPSSTIGTGGFGGIGDMDDDASLGIAHDLDEEMSLADSIGEGAGAQTNKQLKDEELERAKREKRMNLMTSREKEALLKREDARKLRERIAKRRAERVRVPPNPTDELCAECDDWFSGKSKYSFAS